MLSNSIKRNNLFKDQSRSDMEYDLWREGVHLFNKIAELVPCIPPAAKYDISQKLMKAAQQVPFSLAKLSNAKEKRGYEKCLHQGVDAIGEAVSLVYISSKLGFVGKGYFEEIYKLGEKLSSKLRQLNHETFTVQELN